MPYFNELNDLARQAAEWADLRHEQGVPVKLAVARLRRELARAVRELKRAKPSSQARRREPNDLDSIQALRPKGPRIMWDALRETGLKDRMRGAWLGRAAACTLGAPVENWSIDAMARLAEKGGDAFPPEDYWSTHPSPGQERYGASTIADYLRGGLTCIPVDDDLTYTILGLLILETYGPGFTVDDVGRAWLDWLPMACTAEHVALENLKAGVPASKAGEKDNPYQEWIGADIRSDPWGYAAPGWPEGAAEMAYRDAYLSHRQNGVYGAMLFAAAIAAAFALDDPVEAVRVGLTEIPKGCRLARDMRWALKVGPELPDWRAARSAVDERFAGMHSVHTNNNACLTVFGLMLGEMDFTKTIGITVAMGLDNDCTAATAGSILGAVIGARAIPPHWWKPYRNRTRTYLRGHEWFSNTDLIDRFMAAARCCWDIAP
ncbi:MAG: ADP-ribosylglycohydrolase family protein [bacterium]|nr:ADP-ribosylglycohydrolase family protein [bacterium]